MTSLDDALASAKRPERTVPLCLRGDLQAQFEDLERALHAAQQDPRNDTMSGSPEVQSLAEQIEAVRAEMSESTVVLHLRAISNPEWNALVAAHEPRKDNQADAAFGYNHEAFFPALVKACLLDVTPVQWASLLEKMSSGQFEELSEASVAVSRRKVDVPKSFAASEALRSAAVTPSSPDN